MVPQPFETMGEKKRGKLENKARFKESVLGVPYLGTACRRRAAKLSPFSRRMLTCSGKD
jgi:hypothetical protein